MEGGPHYDIPLQPTRGGRVMPTESAIAAAIVEAVRRLASPLIFTFTRSGFTARVVSSFRPPVPILALTDSVAHLQPARARLGGDSGAPAGEVSASTRCWTHGRETALRLGLAERGQRVVVTAGLPMHVSGTTNTMRVEEI